VAKGIRNGDTRNGDTRDGRGRFRPGQSGNPAGKKLGTLNRATLLGRWLAEADADRIAQAVIRRALEGDTIAARFVLARVDAKPRGRPVRLDLPTAATLAERFDAVFVELAAGRVTPDEALTIAGFLERHGKATCGLAREPVPAAPAAAPRGAAAPPPHLHFSSTVQATPVPTTPVPATRRRAAARRGAAS
jgi:hypothetical protein